MKGVCMSEQTQEPSQTQPEPKTFTQEEVNELMGKVRRETKEKYAGYDELKAKAEKYDEAQEKAKTELERATERAAKAEEELSRLQKVQEHQKLVAKVASATGVPAGLISGATEEEMTACAEAIAVYAKETHLKTPEDKGGAAKPQTLTKEQILAIKNPKERRDAIKANVNLFS